MPNSNFSYFAKTSAVAFRLIIAHLSASEYQLQRSYDNSAIAIFLTDIIESLEAFHGFEPTARATAIALYASELGISQLHFYAIALHAGLVGTK